MNKSEQLRASIYAALTESQLGEDGLTLMDKFTMEEIYELGDKLLERIPDGTIDQVKEFHESFNHPILKEPTIPDTDRIMLRLKLIFEELFELGEAAGRGLDFFIYLASFVSKKGERDDFHHAYSKIEMLDAVVDLEYVLMGSVLEFGFADIFDAAFKEVHESNMSKACPTLECAERTIDKRLETHNEHCVYLHKPGYGYLIFNSDGKSIKSVDYTPANLRPLIYPK